MPTQLQWLLHHNYSTILLERPNPGGPAPKGSGLFPKLRAGQAAETVWSTDCVYAWHGTDWCVWIVYAQRPTHYWQFSDRFMHLPKQHSIWSMSSILQLSKGFSLLHWTIIKVPRKTWQLDTGWLIKLLLSSYKFKICGIRSDKPHSMLNAARKWQTTLRGCSEYRH